MDTGSRSSIPSTLRRVCITIRSHESKKKDRYEDAKKFVRYSDGAKMYSMGMTKFQEVAKDAKACYKIGQLVLVNTEILDKYLETFHITDSEFYK